MIIYRPDGTVLLDVAVDDDSYRYVELMGKDELFLKFALAEYIDIPLGSYCVPDFVKPQTQFEVMLPSSVSVVNRRNFEYSVTMESSFGHLRKYRIHNMVDGRLRFDLTATPREHLEQIVSNLQERDPQYGWAVGVCIEENARLISYDHSTCEDALKMLAEAFDTEFEIKGGVISVHSVDYNMDSPLPLAYGCGNGFRSGVARTNFNDSLPVERLFVQGGDRNINRKDYATDENGTNGSSTLLLPADGTRVKFNGSEYKYPSDAGYSSFAGREYKVDNRRMSVVRADRQMFTKNEDSLDLSEVYPKRVGRVSRVRYEYKGSEYKFSELPADVRNGDWDSAPLNAININLYDDDPTIPDYEQCRIAGEQMTVVFQSGMLAGRELNLFKFVRGAGRIEIQRQEIDGVLMPGNVYRVNGDEDNGAGLGDEYVVFNCSMPQSYYTAAEKELLEKAVKYLYEHEDVTFSFKGELDGIFTKKNWTDIGYKLVIGGHVAFRDRDILGAEDSFDTRIESIKQYVNNPHSPTITLGNEPARATVASVIKRVEAERVHVEELHSDSIQYTKRSFKSALESLSMIEEALAGQFSESINPVAVRTMSMLVGAESLQFKVFNTAFTKQIPFPCTYEGGNLEIAPCGIRHYSLGVDKGTPESEYLKWTFPRRTFSPAEDARAYYLYAKVSTTSDGDADFVLTHIPQSFDAEYGYYHLLVGILSSEDSDGNRSFAPCYGFTEILPNRITSGLVISADGKTYFDLDNGIINGKIQFTAGSSGLENIPQWNGMAKDVEDTKTLAEQAAENITEINRTITEMNDDGTLDVNEKQSVRTQWENINGQATTERIESSVTGTYWLVKRSFRNYTFPTTESTFLYGGVLYTYYQIGIVYNLLGLGELDSAYTRLRNYLDSISLYADIPSSSFDRVVMATKFTDYYEAERRVSDNIVIDNKVKVDDLEYLSNALAKDSDNVTDIAGGVVLSKVIGVREGNAMVAGMNSTDIAKDAEKGKLMMFAGADPNLQGTEAKMQSAKFKVYANGRVESTSGNIGSYEIGANFLESKREEFDDSKPADDRWNYSMRLSPAMLYFHSQNMEMGDGTIGSDVYMSTYPSAVSSKMILQRMIATYNAGSRETDYNIANMSLIGLYISAKGAKKPVYSNGVPYGGNFALWCEEGMTAGLRPHVRGISGDATLSDADHTIVVNNSAAMTLTLPSSPQYGQEYEIWHLTTSKLTIRSIIEQIRTITGTSKASSVDITSRCRIKLVYCPFIEIDVNNAHWIMFVDSN